MESYEQFAAGLARDACPTTEVTGFCLDTVREKVGNFDLDYFNGCLTRKCGETQRCATRVANHCVNTTREEQGSIEDLSFCLSEHCWSEGNEALNLSHIESDEDEDEEVASLLNLRSHKTHSTHKGSNKTVYIEVPAETEPYTGCKVTQAQGEKCA